MTPSPTHTEADSPTPPLLDELTDEQFAKFALAAALTNDISFLHLASLLDTDQLERLMLVYSGSRLFVPKMGLFNFIEDAVDAALAVANGDLTLAQAVRTHQTPKRIIEEAVAAVQAHTAALDELQRKQSHRQAKQRYRAKRRAEGFSTRNRPLKPKS